VTARLVHVVDDENAIRRSLQLMLRVLGYDARSFESGAAFLAAQPELAGGCVLLDLRMPEIDGFGVQRELNAGGSEHSVIVMSGHGDVGLAVTAMELGAIAFLEKPFSRAALEEVLRLGLLRLDDAEGYRDYLRSAARAVQGLQTADQHVLELIARGHDTESVAEQLGQGAPAMEIARSRIHAQLGTSTVAELLQLAFAARRAAQH